MTVTWRKRRDLNPRTLASRSLSSSAFARSGASRDALTCGFRDGCNLRGAAVRRRTETQTETWWLLHLAAPGAVPGGRALAAIDIVCGYDLST